MRPKAAAVASVTVPLRASTVAPTGTLATPSSGRTRRPGASRARRRPAATRARTPATGASRPSGRTSSASTRPRRRRDRRRRRVASAVGGRGGDRVAAELGRRILVARAVHRGHRERVRAGAEGRPRTASRRARLRVRPPCTRTSTPPRWTRTPTPAPARRSRSRPPGPRHPRLRCRAIDREHGDSVGAGRADVRARAARVDGDADRPGRARARCGTRPPPVQMHPAVPGRWAIAPCTRVAVEHRDGVARHARGVHARTARRDRDPPHPVQRAPGGAAGVEERDAVRLGERPCGGVAVNVDTAPPISAAAYTFSPSGLSASDHTPASARPSAHCPPVPSSDTQPAGPGFWASAPAGRGRRRRCCRPRSASSRTRCPRPGRRNTSVAPSSARAGGAALGRGPRDAARRSRLLGERAGRVAVEDAHAAAEEAT